MRQAPIIQLPLRSIKPTGQRGLNAPFVSPSCILSQNPRNEVCDELLTHIIPQSPRLALAGSDGSRQKSVNAVLRLPAL